MADTRLSQPQNWSDGELREARRRAGLTQSELADRLGVRLWIVDQWESGTRQIPTNRFEDLAEALGSAEEAGRADRSRGDAEPPNLQAAPTSTKMAAVAEADNKPPDLPRSVRGYDPSAVHAYLGKREAESARLTKELNAARSRIAELEERLGAMEERAEGTPGDAPDLSEEEALLRDILVTAQKAANDVRARAQQEATEITESARRDSQQMLRNTEKQRDRLSEEIRRLESHLDSSRAAVTAFLQSLLDEVEARSSRAKQVDGSPVFDDTVLKPMGSREDEAEQQGSPAGGPGSSQ